jgi:hypothetical protein
VNKTLQARGKEKEGCRIGRGGRKGARYFYFPFLLTWRTMFTGSSNQYTNYNTPTIDLSL